MPILWATRAHSDEGPPPAIVIESRTANSDVVHVKGFIDGIALVRGGIYAGGRCVKAFAIKGVPGKQRIDLDISIENPAPDTIIRVTDADGRSAEAPFFGVPAAEPAAAEKADVAPVGSGAIAEIPSHGPALPSPSKRRTLASKLPDAQIRIISLEQTSIKPPTYEVVGQIEGRGITHAGIYVDDRLVRTLPTNSGADFVSFDEHIILENPKATIRAYALADHYVETSLDLANATVAADDLPPPEVAAAPHDSIAVQILQLQSLSTNLCSVNGVITGSDLAQAGLFQNGALTQNIDVDTGAIKIAGGGSASSLIDSWVGSHLSGGPHQVKFNVRFNPQAGKASIRAYKNDGSYVEQPVLVGTANNPATERSRNPLHSLW